MAERTPHRAIERMLDGRRTSTDPLQRTGARLPLHHRLRSAVLALVVRVALLATLVALAQGLLVSTPAAYAAGNTSSGSQPNHSPNTLNQFHASGTATGNASGGTDATHALKNPGPQGGTPPDKAPASVSPANLKPVEIPLDSQFLATTTAAPGAGIWTSSSDGVIDVQVAPNSVDLSAATVNGAPIGPIATPTAPTTTPTPAPTATPAASPTASPTGSPTTAPASSPTASATASPTAATPAATATQSAAPDPTPTPVPSATATVSTTTSSSASSGSSGAAAPLATSLAPTPVTSAASAGAAASGFTLELKQTQGSYRGDGMQLGAYTLHVLDSQQRELQHVHLRAPIQIRFHYGTADLSGINSADLRLVWPSTANEKANRPAQSVPLTLDTQAHTLTATVSTLYAGPMLMAAAPADANAASSEHALVAGNTGDLTFSLPLATPPAAGSLAPNLTLAYSSAGPNGRSWRGAPAPAVGDGWDLSLGSITYDATTGLFYLNGIAGENEPLLCCVVNAAQGNINYFVPHHHNNIHITTYPNTQHPNQTGAGFYLRTPDGTEYQFGVTPDSLRSTVTGGAKTYYEWDLSAVYRRSTTSSTFLQEYSISYWQDLATSGGITYVRDAMPRVINYNYVNGSPQDQVWFNIHWPGATTTNGSGTANSYGTNYNCSGSPLVATTLRCDDPVTPSGYEAAPLTMTTITLDSVVMEAFDGSNWQNVRRYDFTYAPDSANYECWDDVTGTPYACSGEHLLTSVQETPYQSGSGARMPSQQPTTFTYTAARKNEYNDFTVNGFDGNPFNAQTWWQYLSSFSDAQTGAKESVTWQAAWGNTHGVPSGSNVLSPWACNSATCDRADDRQWMRQSVASTTDIGDNNATTTYSYVLNQACGSGCTQDTWIAPNAWNACGGVVQGPTYPNGSCLVSGPYANYYNELFTGFVQVYVTDTSGSTNYTQYFAGDGWGSNDFQFPNAYEGFPVVEQTYAGAASGAPLEEVDHLYTESNCPPIDSSGNQLYVANLMLCDTWETQRDTWIGGASGTSGIPHETETWTYDTTASPALGLAYNPLTADAVTSNDALTDSTTSGGASYGSTQPTFTTNTTYVRHDGNLDSPNNGFYLGSLPAQVTLDDSAGNRWTCEQISYDQQGYATGESAGLTAGLPTRVDQWANCGTSGNGYAPSGVVTTGTGYDAHGQPIVTTDADALASIGGHSSCTLPVGVTPLVVYPANASGYTTCTQYDGAQQVYPTSSANALNQPASSTYDVVQGVATSSKDVNGVTTSYGGPVYEYSGSPSLATFQDVYTQTTLPGEILGGSSPWTTRVFAYSFCAGATGSATSPCLEVDTVRQSDASDTLVSRVFYDRDGRQVETRTTSPVSGQDTVTITAYNDANHSRWTSLDCTTPVLTTTNGGRAVTSTPNYIAPTQASTGSSAWVNPAVGGTSCSSGTLTGTTTWYDALGRTVATDDPLGTGVGASGTGCLLSGGSVHHTTCVVYTPVIASSPVGLPSTDGEPYLQAVTIDANLHQQASYTDALGRVAYTQELSGASQQAFGSGITSYAVTSNQYDPTGALRQVTDPQGHVTTFTDDALGRQTALHDPNRGAETYSYDANGNVITTVDARGANGTIDAGYDGLNRQTWRRASSNGVAYVTYTYDSTAGSNFGVGRLTGENFSNANIGGNLTGSYAYTYDNRGRTTATVETVDGTPYTTSATYNDLDQLVTQTYPNGDVVTSAYNAATGRESALNLKQSGASGSVGLLTNETYSGQSGAAGLLTGATLGAFTSGSGAYSATYDGLLRLTTSAYSYTPSGGSASTLYQAQPTYDAVGNVTSETTTLPQGVDTQAFCYDAQNRLIWAGSSGTAPCGSSVTPGETGSLAGTGASYSASYAYDTLNRLTNAPLGASTYGDSAHVDAATAVGSAWSASYDAAGNMTCRAASSATTCAGASPTGAPLSYDNEGRLTAWQNAPGSSSTSSLHDLYDGEGHRVAEQAVQTGSGDSTATTAFIGGLEEVTTSAPTVWLSSFSPTSGPVGTSVTVTGSGFNTTAGATSVSFNGVPATSVSVTSATQLTAVVPAGASSGPLTVSTSQGSATTSGETPSSFTVATTPPAPTLTSFSPTSGPVGTIVTLLGSGLTGATGVTFNGVAATSFSVVSDSQLTATVPSGAATGPISVTTPGGVATTTSVFTVSAAPSDTLFSDNFEQDTLGAAPAGWSVTSGTWAVENDGTHVLQQTDTTISSSVYITPTVAGSANWTDYTVSADVKPGADDTSVTSANLMGRYTDSDNHYSLILKNNDEWWLGVKQAGNWTTIANGTFSYNSNTFYTLTLSLQGTTISGAINGTVVGSGTDSTFSSGGIGFSTAANSELDNVSVVDGTGQGGGSPPPAPTLTSFTPSSGAVGSTVTLTGSGFTGASSVAFHGTLASSFTVVSDSQLTAVVPVGATSGPISVTTPGGSATSSGSFAVTTSPPPPPPTTTTTTTYYGGGIAESVNGTLSYLLSDPILGSASASVNLSGAVTSSQLYAPYGSVRYASGILPTDIGFTHQRVDATSGLDDYGARWYDPLAEQFASADTTLAGGLNRYAYVAGNPETNTDPTGHILRAPTPTTHGYRPQTAYQQWLAQPTQHTYYGSVGAFVTGLPQFVLGTDTLRQAFHTIFQDPKASLADKAKAAGVGLFTVVTDAVTVGSLAVGEPEVGADLRTFDEGLLGADDATHVAATTASDVTEATDASTVATDANEPWYRGLRSDENPSEGLSPQNPNNRVSALQHVRGGSRGNGDQFMSFTKDPTVAVNKYAHGDPSRVVAVNPSGVTGTVYDLTSSSGRLAIGMVPGTPAWNFAAADSEVLLEDGYVPPEAISPFSGGLWQVFGER